MLYTKTRNFRVFELKKAVRRWKEFGKSNKSFTASESKSEDDALAPEGAFVFHTVKHSSSYKTAHYTSFQFKTIFPDFEIAPKFQVRRKRDK